VALQGPPGTGKTHTVANIISHYRARGKRVLLPSQKAPALKVLRDKLPAAVRPLAVSLLDSDRDGLKQFQESVDIIADRLHRTRPTEAAQQIAVLDARIEAIHRQLATTDRQEEDIGRQAMTGATINGAAIEPADAARRVIGAGELADWLPDAIDVIAFGGQHNDGHFVAEAAQAPAYRETVLAGHHQVEHHEVVALARKPAVHVIGIGSRAHAEALIGQITIKQFAQSGVVINDDDACFGFTHGAMLSV